MKKKKVNEYVNLVKYLLNQAKKINITKIDFM